MRIGFDFDGVLSVTPFGRLAVHAPTPVDPLPDGYEKLYDAPVRSNPLRVAVEYARFAWRSPAKAAAPVLRTLSQQHELYIVTGRSRVGESIVRRWIRRQGVESAIVDVRMAPPGLRPPQHKLATAKMLRLDAHIDDDPRTAYHLAQNGVERVYLLDHAGAHGDAPLPAGLTLVRTLTEFAERIAAA
jgi:hypothetical protein